MNAERDKLRLENRILQLELSPGRRGWKPHAFKASYKTASSVT